MYILYIFIRLCVYWCLSHFCYISFIGQSDFSSSWQPANAVWNKWTVWPLQLQFCFCPVLVSA